MIRSLIACLLVLMFVFGSQQKASGGQQKPSLPNIILISDLRTLTTEDLTGIMAYATERVIATNRVYKGKESHYLHKNTLFNSN